MTAPLEGFFDLSFLSFYSKLVEVVWNWIPYVSMKVERQEESYTIKTIQIKNNNKLKDLDKRK